MLKKLLFAGALWLTPFAAYADGCISPPTTNLGSVPITVTTTATLIAAARCRNAITIVNNGTANVEIAGSNTVTTSGYGYIAPGATISLQTTSALWGISTGSEVLSVFETF